MKRFFCLTLILALLCGGAPALAQEGLTEVHCQEQGFSTWIPEGLDARWEDGAGLRISVKKAGYVPYLLITRRENKLNNPVNYLNNVYREYMENKYGDDMVGTIPCKTYEIGGKTLYMAQYFYNANGARLCFMRLVEVREDGDVEYGAKFVDGQGDETLAVLDTAVKHYQPDEAKGKAAPGTDAAGASLNAVPARPIVSQTKAYSDGRFHMKLPAGWQITTQSEYMTFCFKAWDPANPNRNIFLFMKLEPFLKSQAAKAWYKQVVGGDPNSIYRLYGEAPVMEACTLEAFLNTMPEIYAYCEKFYEAGWTISPSVLPHMTDVEIVEKKASTLPAPPDCKENAIARIAFKDYLGQSCEGLVTAQPRDPMQYYIANGVDTMGYTVSLFMGVTSPVGELQELEPVLMECLGSFAFEDSYVKQAINVSIEQTQELQRQMRQMEAAHDALVQAWYDREAAHDIAFQKLSDSILGYDRLYDSATGEIYRADVGFYDTYDLHRSEYSNSNLQLIDNSSQNYYLQGVDYYITK